MPGAVGGLGVNEIAHATAIGGIGRVELSAFPKGVEGLTRGIGIAGEVWVLSPAAIGLLRVAEREGKFREFGFGGAGRSS